jgi:hypothetical protein
MRRVQRRRQKGSLGASLDLRARPRARATRRKRRIKTQLLEMSKMELPREE